MWGLLRRNMTWVDTDTFARQQISRVGHFPA